MVIVDSSNSYAFRVSMNKTSLRSFYFLQIHVLTIHVLTDSYELVSSCLLFAKLFRKIRLKSN